MKKNLPSGGTTGVTAGSVRRSKRTTKHGENDMNSVSSMTDVDLFQAVQGTNLSIYANCIILPYSITT